MSQYLSSIAAPSGAGALLSMSVSRTGFFHSGWLDGSVYSLRPGCNNFIQTFPGDPTLRKPVGDDVRRSRFKFSRPAGMCHNPNTRGFCALDGETLFVSDANMHMIFEIDSQRVRRIAGTFVEETDPWLLSYDPDADIVNAYYHYQTHPTPRHIADGPALTEAIFAYPTSIVAFLEVIWVLDSFGTRIRMIDQRTQLVSTLQVDPIFRILQLVPYDAQPSSSPHEWQESPETPVYGLAVLNLDILSDNRPWLVVGAPETAPLVFSPSNESSSTTSTTSSTPTTTTATATPPPSSSINVPDDVLNHLYVVGCYSDASVKAVDLNAVGNAILDADYRGQYTPIYKFHDGKGVYAYGLDRSRSARVMCRTLPATGVQCGYPSCDLLPLPVYSSSMNALYCYRDEKRELSVVQQFVADFLADPQRKVDFSVLREDACPFAPDISCIHGESGEEVRFHSRLILEKLSWPNLSYHFDKRQGSDEYDSLVKLFRESQDKAIDKQEGELKSGGEDRSGRSSIDKGEGSDEYASLMNLFRESQDKDVDNQEGEVKSGGEDRSGRGSVKVDGAIVVTHARSFLEIPSRPHLLAHAIADSKIPIGSIRSFINYLYSDGNIAQSIDLVEMNDWLFLLTSAQLSCGAIQEEVTHRVSKLSCTDLCSLLVYLAIHYKSPASSQIAVLGGDGPNIRPLDLIMSIHPSHLFSLLARTITRYYRKTANDHLAVLGKKRFHRILQLLDACGTRALSSKTNPGFFYREHLLNSFWCPMSDSKSIEALHAVPSNFFFQISGTPNCLVTCGVMLYPLWSWFRRLVHSGMEEARTRFITLSSSWTYSALTNVISVLETNSMDCFKILRRKDMVAILRNAEEFSLAVTETLEPLEPFKQLIEYCKDNIFVSLTPNTCIEALNLAYDIGSSKVLYNVLDYFRDNMDCATLTTDQIQSLYPEVLQILDEGKEWDRLGTDSTNPTEEAEDTLPP